MRWNLPNTLTILRLLAAPALVLVYEILPRPWSDWGALTLFLAAAFTDYFDGVIARRWKQVSAFGRMLDPIADKAMTMIALVMLAILFFRDGRVIVFPTPANTLVGDWILITPIMIIILREVFISGLREFLGEQAHALAVTRIAKWKTAIQMAAVAVLFSVLLFEHYFAIVSFAMERSFVQEVLAGNEVDEFGLRWKYYGWIASYNTGVALLWGAAVLTLITGLDYFRKSLPFLDDR